ncbi:uncharacterized protein CPUR_07967 [Claviceps purpurea 20.1]|uniref:Uncharacterized protein n=1 Tax=Claviceps purpurea (strain 20.1) TaxID=1111077 RepID=M1W5F0_CLAP2|nr:uncharacterized protein CPUR_07967 [Claviceps purpurea 20.1]
MQLNSLLVNLLLTSLAAARYISSDPATCSKPPVKRGLRLHGETPEQNLAPVKRGLRLHGETPEQDLAPVKRGLRLHDETPELDLELDARSPMGGSSIQGRGTEKEACLRCCHIGTNMCNKECENKSQDGAGDLRVTIVLSPPFRD